MELQARYTLAEIISLALKDLSEKGLVPFEKIAPKFEGNFIDKDLALVFVVDYAPVGLPLPTVERRGRGRPKNPVQEITLTIDTPGPEVVAQAPIPFRASNTGT